MSSPKPRISRKIMKSNQFIESQNNLSAMEHRIILLALLQIQSTHQKLNKFRINIRDILGNGHSSHYHLVRKSLKKLYRSTIEVEDADKWGIYSLIANANSPYGKNYIEIEFHDHIEIFLLNLRAKYTTYSFDNVLHFKKNYSLRIYELCKQYQNLGSREMTLVSLKKLFFLQDKYQKYFLFKKKVIEAALQEINKFSDLLIKFEEIKDGRKIDKIRFIIQENPDFLPIQDSNILSEKGELHDSQSNFKES